MINPTHDYLKGFRSLNYVNEPLAQFKKGLPGKKIAVLGFGISNHALLRFLTDNGAKNVFLFDMKADGEAVGEAERMKADGRIAGYRFGEGYLDELPEGGFDMIFRSPIMRPDEEHIDAAVRAGARLTSEMEIFMEHCPCRIFAITGSDGKTTTTTLTALLLEEHFSHYNELCGAEDRVSVWLGGNIGTPLIDRLDDIGPEDRVVLELSSFQLMQMSVSADVSAITNITPNHLNVHKDYNEYIDCKRAVFEKPLHGALFRIKNPAKVSDDAHFPRFPEVSVGGNAKKRVVLNAGNDVSLAIINDLASCGWKNGCERVVVDTFSARKSREIPLYTPHNGSTAFFEPAEGDDSGQSGKIVIDSFCNGCGSGGCAGQRFELDRASFLLPGRHNIENLMTAALLTRDEVSAEDVAAVASTFGGVEHRLEKVRELDGVTYINSSIDSSPERTINALSVFNSRNIVMIAGGKDKNLDYGPIGPAIVAKVRVLILTGPTAEKIAAAVASAPGGDAVKIIRVNTYEEAVNAARANALPGNIVLLSPASTSFDMFKNFEERGNTFKRLVNSL